MSDRISGLCDAEVAAAAAAAAAAASLGLVDRKSIDERERLRSAV